MPTTSQVPCILRLDLQRDRLEVAVRPSRSAVAIGDPLAEPDTELVAAGGERPPREDLVATAERALHVIRTLIRQRWESHPAVVARRRVHGQGVAVTPLGIELV